MPTSRRRSRMHYASLARPHLPIGSGIVEAIAAIRPVPLFFAPELMPKKNPGALAPLVRRYRGQRVFLIIDNGPCHNLPEDGKKWLKKNSKKLRLHRLPPYSPQFNAIEGVWKVTRKLTTHNRFYKTVDERDGALRKTFRKFQQKPSLISAHVKRFK